MLPLASHSLQSGNAEDVSMVEIAANNSALQTMVPQAPAGVISSSSSFGMSQACGDAVARGTPATMEQTVTQYGPEGIMRQAQRKLTFHSPEKAA